MFDLVDAVELKATSEDPDGRLVDVSFATQNWQKAIRDRRRPGYFVRRHVEAMVFFYLAEELRRGDVAVIGSEEYADWSEQLLPRPPYRVNSAAGEVALVGFLFRRPVPVSEVGRQAAGRCPTDH